MKPITEQIPDFLGCDLEMCRKWDIILALKDIETNYNILEISNALAYKYSGDMYGLCAELGISAKYVYPLLRINGMFSSKDFNPNKLPIYTLSKDFLSKHKSLLES